MPGLPNLANLDYVDRVNRAVDYATRNVDQPLRLEAVARAACFSAYHFHRIFRTLMGETLASFVTMFSRRSERTSRLDRARRLQRGEYLETTITKMLGSIGTR